MHVPYYYEYSLQSNNNNNNNNNNIDNGTTNIHTNNKCYYSEPVFPLLLRVLVFPTWTRVHARAREVQRVVGNTRRGWLSGSGSATPLMNSMYPHVFIYIYTNIYI